MRFQRTIEHTLTFGEDLTLAHTLSIMLPSFTNINFRYGEQLIHLSIVVHGLKLYLQAVVLNTSPPYLPDYNPIEQAFSTIKSHLR